MGLEKNAYNHLLFHNMRRYISHVVSKAVLLFYIVHH